MPDWNKPKTHGKSDQPKRPPAAARGTGSTRSVAVREDTTVRSPDMLLRFKDDALWLLNLCKGAQTGHFKVFVAGDYWRPAHPRYAGAVERACFRALQEIGFPRDPDEVFRLLWKSEHDDLDVVSMAAGFLYATQLDKRDQAEGLLQRFNYQLIEQSPVMQMQHGDRAKLILRHMGLSR